MCVCVCVCVYRCVSCVVWCALCKKYNPSGLILTTTAASMHRNTNSKYVF